MNYRVTGLEDQWDLTDPYPSGEAWYADVARVLRAAPTLDTKRESLISTFGLATRAARSTHEVLSNAEIRWPTVKLSE
jgi:oligoendopeptidase F